MDRGVNLFGSLASLASVAIAAVPLVLSGSTKDTVQAVLSLLAVVAFGGAYYRFRRYEPQSTSTIPKKDLIEVSCKHIRSAQSKVIMFSNDLSWASAYAEALENRISAGKKVVVIHKKSAVPKVVANSEYLRKLGAEVIELQEDHEIRATLIDPDDADTALLFAASKKRQPGSAAPIPGETGSDADHIYECAVYQGGNHKAIVKAIRRLAAYGYPAKAA